MINTFKINALKVKVMNLKKGKMNCKNSKDSSKCNTKIDEKINKVKNKIEAYTP